MYFVVGLGNPGEKYKNSRHSAGRIILELYVKNLKLPPFEFDKKTNSLMSEIKKKAVLILPETFMNNSGIAVKKIITSKIKAKNLVVAHDDIDLPLGKFKISFNRSSAGHKGIESIVKNIKTNEFTRVRIGVSPKTPKGKIKKPETKKIVDFIISDFKKDELLELTKLSKKIFEALNLIIEGNINKAMNTYNT